MAAFSRWFAFLFEFSIGSLIPVILESSYNLTCKLLVETTFDLQGHSLEGCHDAEAFNDRWAYESSQVRYGFRNRRDSDSLFSVHEARLALQTYIWHLVAKSARSKHEFTRACR
jgi:hypothetical protein